MLYVVGPEEDAEELEDEDEDQQPIKYVPVFIKQSYDVLKKIIIVIYH